MTTNNSLKYTLNDVNNIIFQGFDYTIPNETLEIISLLSMQVGSPDYVKTPIFKKREIPELSKDFKETNIKIGERIIIRINAKNRLIILI